MTTASASPLGALAVFPLEIRRIIYDFTLDHTEQDYHFEVEANKVLHVPEATLALPRPTPVLAHVCGEMRDHFLETHTQASFTCAAYARSCTEGGCWEERADPAGPLVASRTGWFNRRSDRVTFSRHVLLPPTREECGDSVQPEEDESEDEEPETDFEEDESEDESPISTATQPCGKQSRELLLSVEPYHVTDFVKLVEAARCGFVEENPDEETCVYPNMFHDIIQQGPAVLIRRAWCA
ncbi:hypothetical protein Daus18300_012435 [Diaporthe australafricana]|uniref:2EXR domain-containing protein n=1 Tax=Diaporthe australafricana TaxID=127596 RepID=A0ABR3W2W1_9PEZI